MTAKAIEGAAFQNTDDADPLLVLSAVRHCASSWEGNARLLGNVRAKDIVRAIDAFASGGDRVYASANECLVPKSDRDDLDEVCRELGIQDSEVTPAQAVRELNAEIERLSAIASGALVPASAVENREEIAAYLLARDEEYAVTPHMLQWARNLISAGKDAVHSGDCTNESHACDRCIADKALDDGSQIAAHIRQLDLSPACGDYVVVPRTLTEAMKETAAHIADGPFISAQEHWTAMLAAATRTGGTTT